LNIRGWKGSTTIGMDDGSVVYLKIQAICDIEPLARMKRTEL